MSKRDVPAAMAPVQSFHPEFGYFCPSAGLKRKLHTALKGTLAVALIAGGVALAVSALVMPQRSQVVRTEASAVAALRVDEPAAMPPSTSPLAEVQAHAMPAVVPVDNAALARAQATCDDLSASFLAGGCQVGKKAHLRRSPQDAAHRVAAAPLGRTEAIPPAEAPQAAAAQPVRAPEARSAVAASAVAPAVDRDPEASPASDKPVKKPLKTVQKRPPSTAPVETAATQPAQASPLGGLFDLFRSPPRYANGPGTTFWQ
jgi:hypothetical protein